MAVLFVTEFSHVHTDHGGAPVGDVASIQASQTAAIGGSSTPVANAFQPNTRFVRLNTDAVCSVAFGAGTPTATATSMRLAANQTEYFKVPENQGWKVAVITNT